MKLLIALLLSVVLTGCAEYIPREQLIHRVDLQDAIEAKIPSTKGVLVYGDDYYRLMDKDKLKMDGWSWAGYVPHLNDCDDAVVDMIAHYHEYVMCFLGYNTEKGAHAVGLMMTTDYQLYFMNPQYNEMRGITEEVADHIDVWFGFCF